MSAAGIAPAILMAMLLTANAAEPWTLERSLDYALAHNPDARLAQQRIAVAKAGLEQANSAFWPQLQFQSSYTRTDNPMQVFGSILNQRAYDTALNFNHVPDVDNFNAKGLIAVPLYAGGRNKARRDAAQADAAAAKLDDEAVRNEIAFEVVRAFHTVLKARQFIHATEASVQAFEGDLSVARKRFDAGTLLKSDVLDAEVRLGQAREDCVRARNAKALAERALKNLLGLEDGEFVVADHAPNTRSPDSLDFSHRPELASAAERLRAAQAGVRGAKGDFLPRVSAFGSLDYDRGWVTGGDGHSYLAGVMAQWNLWDGFSTRAKVREARANLQIAREEQRQLRLAIDLEVERAWLNLQAANERLAVSEKSVDQAEESASLTRRRFEQGLVLPTQLFDSETALIGARVRRAESEADQRIAIAALRKALALPQLDSTAN